MIESVEQTGNRSKAIYRITKQGEEHFIQLLREALQSSSVHLPSQLYTALSFIQEIDREEALLGLQLQRKLIIEQLEQQKAGIEVKRQLMNVDPVVEYLFQNLYKQYELQLELLDQLIAHYEQKQAD